MIHLVVLAAALLHLQDPAGDAVGDGSLTPPTAAVYANTADFDLQSVTVTDDPKLTVRVTLGSLGNPGDLPNGFSNPVVEVYLDTRTGGAHALLPGSTMSMPDKRGWNVALRATGDQVYAVTPEAQGDPGSWPHRPATLHIQGNTLVIGTDLPRPDHADVYALTGVYDPFAGDAWRPLTPHVSPWAFSSSTQKAPVVDLLANSMAAQRAAIDSGTLVPYRSPTHGIGWLLLMAGGLLVAAAGLVVRRRVQREEPARPVAALPPPAAEAAPEEERPPRRLPTSWGEMPPTEPSFLDDLEEASLWPAGEDGPGRGAAGATSLDEASAGDDGADPATAPERTDGASTAEADPATAPEPADPGTTPEPAEPATTPEPAEPATTPDPSRKAAADEEDAAAASDGKDALAGQEAGEGATDGEEADGKVPEEDCDPPSERAS